MGIPIMVGGSSAAAPLLLPHSLPGHSVAEPPKSR